jgi:molecular chaperone GrpE
MRKKQKIEDPAGDSEPGNGFSEDADSVPAVDNGAAEMPEEIVVADERASEEDGLVRELEELQDRHLRLAAEFENYRKRTRRELGEARKRAQADLMARVLDILDDLTRVAQLPGETPVESVVEGVRLVEAKMKKELGDAGLRRIEAAGARFDPNLHEALATRPTEDPQDEDTISDVLREGYTFDDLLVRPSRVAVKKFTPAGDAEPAQAREPDEI